MENITISQLVAYAWNSTGEYLIPKDATFEGVSVDINEHGRIMFPIKVKYLYNGKLLTFPISEAAWEKGRK